MENKLNYNVIKALGFSSAVLLLSLCVTQNTFARTVTCQIDERNQTTFKGKCIFNSFEGGSFYLTNINPEKPLFRSIMDVSVIILEPSVAEVRGQVKGGLNSRWGQAIRSSKQKACWVGHDFKVCAW